MKTFSAKNEEVQRDWYVVDASNKTLGRLASDIAHRLRGKHKAEYTPHVDTGDYIVVVNAAEIAVTGRKMTGKIYHHHTGYPGGLKSISLEKLMDKAPTRALESAIKGMLPKNPLGRQMFRKLKIYPGADHPHTAQQPQNLDFDEVKAGLKHVAPAKFNGQAKKPVAVAKPKAKPAATKSTPDAPGLQTAVADKISFAGKKFKVDDLKIVEGVGPKIEGLLHDAGIKTWADLANGDVDKIRAVLAEAGSRYSMHDPATWPKQAGMCVAQQWDELQVYQDALDGGKEVE